MIVVGVITSWPPYTCGLSEYSKYLYETLAKIFPKVRIVIYACKVDEQTSAKYKLHIAKLDNIVVKYSWNNRSFTYPFKLFRNLVRDRVRLVHIQHEYWVYGRGLKALLLPLLMVMLKLSRRKIILTLHGILYLSKLNKSFKRHHKTRLPIFLVKLFALVYMRLLDTLSNIIIVHLDMMRRVLAEEYRVKKDKIHVIKHGVDDSIIPKFKPTLAYVKILTFGTLRPDKGIEHILTAFKELVRKHPDLRLIIAGSYNPYISPESKGYLKHICSHIKEDKINKNVYVYVNVPQEQISKLYEDADIIILNYQDESVLAASGPLALAIAYEKPIIVTDIPRFMEYKPYTVTIRLRDVDSLKRALERLINDKKTYEKLVHKLRGIKAKLSWRNMAYQHIQLYQRLLKP